MTAAAKVRWLGFLGALCCAADAVLFGAPTWIRQGVSVVSILRGSNGVLILLLWIAGLAALCAAWWQGRRLTLTRSWILVTAALWILPLLVVPPLASRDMYAYACQGALFDAGYNPSVDAIAAQPCPWIESVSVVWRSTPTPYGPLWILLTGFAASFGSQVVALGIFRVYAVLAVAGLALALPPLARRLGVDENRALWLVLCCPLVAVHFIGGAHNDTLAMALLAAGLALVTRGSARFWIAGGALIGAAIAIKTTVGVVLPFAAVLAAGGFSFDRLTHFLRRGGAVVGGAAALLVILSVGSGLGFGWATSLSGAGESRSWTSPPTAVGLAVNAAGKWFGASIDVVPAIRTIAVLVLLIALVVIWWRFRNGDTLYGAGLACLAVIFCAPITQPWYVFWTLVLWAVTTMPIRWLEIVIIASMFLILPNGDGAWKPLQVPFAFLVTGLVCGVAWRSVQWLRTPQLVPR
ncbi:polyprenol phosphomannose-dependent alpha 1,6 mannosyltransferase MptB [Actinoplanes sp. TFC3]|uniref:polyprenol phosphomannose-dependent alpha 1,6 mannosyltransferase MptB n=1 Tax=Actinoplanes sp. TFC3 TaxID=1710355 RepID=UPI000830CB57|nr:polyprenol phosphomannose-dependent alpha 1,6 mannosyltransferase MptB [Actinoplanes sp. TFC3]